eukprot:scaffold20548_cov223-Amphora_coffeaeformis.AAC.3
MARLTTEEGTKTGICRNWIYLQHFLFLSNDQRKDLQFTLTVDAECDRGICDVGVSVKGGDSKEP